MDKITYIKEVACCARIAYHILRYAMPKDQGVKYLKDAERATLEPMIGRLSLKAGEVLMQSVAKMERREIIPLLVGEHPLVGMFALKHFFELMKEEYLKIETDTLLYYVVSGMLHDFDVSSYSEEDLHEAESRGFDLSREILKKYQSKKLYLIKESDIQ